MTDVSSKKLQFNGNEIVFADNQNAGVAGLSPDQPDQLAEEIVYRWNLCNELVKITESFDMFDAKTCPEAYVLGEFEKLKTITRKSKEGE